VCVCIYVNEQENEQREGKKKKIFFCAYIYFIESKLSSSQ